MKVVGHVYTLQEAAVFFRVSERTIHRWIKCGKLRAYKPGRDYRITEGALLDCFRNNS